MFMQSDLSFNTTCSDTGMIKEAIYGYRNYFAWYIFGIVEPSSFQMRIQYGMHWFLTTVSICAGLSMYLWNYYELLITSPLQCIIVVLDVKQFLEADTGDKTSGPDNALSKGLNSAWRDIDIHNLNWHACQGLLKEEPGLGNKHIKPKICWI